MTELLLSPYQVAYSFCQQHFVHVSHILGQNHETLFLILGLFLLAGVVYTLMKIYKPNDENVKTDKNHSQEGIIK